jgi:tetratricopeptide (TPR) repeat protein
MALKSQADALMATYAVSELPETLLQAVVLYEEALERSLGHETRASHVSDLGNALLLYCSHHGTEPDRLDRCTDLHRELLNLRPSGHPHRDQALHSLSKVLHVLGFETHLSRPEALAEAIQLNREAAQLRPPGHPDREKTLNNLAICLARSYETGGDMNALAESITVLREVLRQRPRGHPRRGDTLGNLGTALLTGFHNDGSYAMLSESMSLCREALHLRPEGHPLHYRALENLANVLQSRFMHNGIVDVEASYEAEGYLRDALRAVPEAHPERRWVMTSLAATLIVRFREQGGSNILDETISLLQTAAASSPPGHHLDETLFNTLAEALELKLDQESDNVALLSEVISLHRTVLKARPHGHARRVDSLHSLARVLCRPQARAYEEALSLYNEALESPLKGYPTRAMVTSDMSACFLDVDSPFFDLLKGVSRLSVGYADHASPINQRLKFAVSDLRRVEDAYQATARNADPTAQAHIDFQVKRLYVQVLGLLPRAANFGIACKARLLAVSGSDEIARNGAARAIISGDFSQSVEMLEEGRGVFWSQSLHLQTGGFEGVPEEEREKLLQLMRLLGNGARRLERHDQTADQREQDFETCRRLNDKAETLILEIRALPGLDRFLLPPAFASLFSALPDGFVVVINASRLGYHGLLCNRATRLATSIKLNPDRSGLDPAILRAKLPRDMESGSQTRGMRLNSGGSGSLQAVLSLLWSDIVQPIISKLGLQVGDVRSMIVTSTDHSYRNLPDVLVRASGGV